MRLLQTLVLSVTLISATATSAASQDSSSNLFTWSGRVAAGGRVTIKHFNGAIDVREGTGDRVEFRAERRTRRSSEVSFEVQNDADGVTLCSVWRGRSACDNGRGRGGWDDWEGGPPSTRVSVTLAKGVRLRASTGNGDVLVEKASNDVDISSGNGDIRISMTAGRVTASTGNGELEVSGATGPVRANTGNGRVYVTTSTGPVEANTGNGEIDVTMKSLSNTSDMQFNTGNGSITVALPSSFNGEIDASTGNGEFRSDFEIRVIGRLNPHHVRGTIGTGGGQLIRMTSGSGRLELRKAN